MKKKYILAASIMVGVLAYELSFRYWTGKNGEVNTDDNPPTLYYSSDLMLGIPLAERIFAWRANLSFGKIKLNEKTGVFISGGEFYRKRSDGSWKNLTGLFAEYRELKREQVDTDNPDNPPENSKNQLDD